MPAKSASHSLARWGVAGSLAIGIAVSIATFMQMDLAPAIRSHLLAFFLPAYLVVNAVSEDPANASSLMAWILMFLQVLLGEFVIGQIAVRIFRRLRSK